MRRMASILCNVAELLAVSLSVVNQVIDIELYLLKRVSLFSLNIIVS